MHPKGLRLAVLVASWTPALCLSLLPRPVLAESLASNVPMENGFPVTKADRIYRLSEVKVGDRGVGFTVFVGAEVKPFGVEVLGILKGMLGPHRPVILARLSGPEVEFTGVVAGMSGSPVFVDGRLMGAVSYRFGAFTKEPIAGITPIEGMLDAEDGSSGAPRARSTLRQGNLRTRDPGRVLSEQLALGRSYRVASGTDLHTPQPIETPIVFSGLTEGAATWLKDELGLSGAQWVAGAAGNLSTGPSPRAMKKTEPNMRAVAGGQQAAPIAPGAPICAVLMRGDLTAAGTGTATFVDGARVIGFGHPFFGYGRVMFPMATASVLNTLSSLAGSYKQVAPALEVGTVTQDRLTGIAGSLMQVAPMVPVSIHVTKSIAPSDLPTAHERWVATSIEIADHDVWLPAMLGAAVRSAAVGRVTEEVGGTIDASIRITLEGRAIEITDTYATPPPHHPGSLVAQDASLLLFAIRHNALGALPIHNIDVRLTTRPSVELAWIEEAVPEKTVVRAGEDAFFRVRMRPYRSGPVVKHMKIPIDRTARGEIEVLIGGAVELDQKDAEVRGNRVPADLDDLLAMLVERRPGGGLWGRSYMRRPGLVRDSAVMTALPPSQRLVLNDRAGTLKKSLSESMGPSALLGVPYVIVGQVSSKLRVVR